MMEEINVKNLWNNGDSGQVVKDVIEYNFALLNKRLDERYFTKTFTSTDWKNGVITVDYYEHRINPPSPHVLMLNNGKYIDVYGGYYIDAENNIHLQSDIPFNGKVVIK